MVGILIIAALPLLLVGTQKLNFNNADELPNSVQSKAGYNVIQDHYPSRNVPVQQRFTIQN